MNARLLGLVATLGLAAVCVGCASPVGPTHEERAAKRAASLLDLAADHLQNGQPAMALRQFLQAEELDPLNPHIQYGLGKAYWGRDRLEDAERHLRRALELYPGHHDARMTLAALMIRSARYEEAIQESDRLIDDATFPAPWTALANRGWAQLQLGQLAASRESLEEALDFTPGFWPATLSLAILETQAGHPLKAVGLYEKLLALSPGPSAESEVNYRLAELYISLGKHRRALGHLTASVAQQPEGPWAEKSEAYLKLLR